MSKNEFSTEDNFKKKKFAPLNGGINCWVPMCGAKVRLSDDMDADLEMAKHRKIVHDIAYPDWVNIVWDKVARPKSARYEKKPNRSKT